MAILFIDCYDSFTYNLVHLIEDTLNVKVAVVHMDSLTVDQLLEILPAVDAVVVGPGPGHPAIAKDSGIIPELWKLSKEHSLPILGVCFGHQSLAMAHGAEIRRLPLPQHGQYGLIHHDGTGLFQGIPDNYKVIRYHSLHAVVPGDSKDLVPLATSEDGVLMSVKHASLPYYGVQFHPESILSTFGPQLMQNFWNIATEFNKTARISARLPWPAFSNNVFVPARPLIKNRPAQTLPPPKITKLDASYDAMNVCQVLYDAGKEFTLLHSAAFPGKWTIIALLDNKAVHIRSKGKTTKIGPYKGKESETKVFEDEDSADSWTHVAAFMADKLRPVDSELPFVGGLVGYITYEKATENEIPQDEDQAQSDASFVYVENCILIGNEGQTYTVGEVDVFDNLEAFKSVNWKFPSLELPEVSIVTPQKDAYIGEVDKCKEFLMSGDSYELCLTGETQATFKKSVEPWHLFKHLVQRNPAPYSTFMAFDDTLVGTSPERFMSWSKEGLCQFRPIKGTVKKGPSMDYEKASAILATPKERSENLMIVDLIRHDLGYLLNNVSCPQLMQVEEYKTVYQLVSVIEGDLPKTPRGVTPYKQDSAISEHIPGELSTNETGQYTGLDVLIHSLPPGSMTGAPKARSVSILKDLEHRARGLYSGVSGYWSIADNGDWSVVIRSAFRYGQQETWRMGAGGAIVVLSDSTAEFEEMQTKLESALQAFT